jgi:hypothetical protein
MKNKSEYRVEVNIYYCYGSIFSTHITADSKKALKAAMARMFIKEKSNSNVEVITFYGARKIAVTELKGLEKSHKLVSKVKNVYIKHQYE